MLEPIADAFSISVTELIFGNTVNNANVSANIKKETSIFWNYRKNKINFRTKKLIYAQVTE